MIILTPEQTKELQEMLDKQDNRLLRILTEERYIAKVLKQQKREENEIKRLEKLKEPVLTKEEKQEKRKIERLNEKLKTVLYQSTEWSKIAIGLMNLGAKVEIRNREDYYYLAEEERRLRKIKETRQHRLYIIQNFDRIERENYQLRRELDNLRKNATKTTL
jgi:hypothetical protein